VVLVVLNIVVQLAAVQSPCSEKAAVLVLTAISPRYNV
jgi:hypothetical protein